MIKFYSGGVLFSALQSVGVFTHTIWKRETLMRDDVKGLHPLQMVYTYFLVQQMDYI